MANNKNRKFNFLFLIAIANLLAAFGGGTVLHLALSVADKEPAFKLGWDAPFLALLIGTTIGLALLGLLNLIKNKWSRASRTAGGYLSFTGAAVAIAVAYLYQNHLDQCGGVANCRRTELYIYYVLLAFLFSLLFVPRILRSDAAAGYKQKIGIVEFCYALGVVLALVSWPQIDKRVPDLRTKLYIDAAFQIFAGLIDIVSSRLSIGSAAEVNAMQPEKETVPESDLKKSRLPVNWSLFAKLTIAVGALTIGIQIVGLEFRQALGSEVSLYLMGGFYLGAAVSALMYGLVLSKLEFPLGSSTLSSFGVVSITVNQKERQLKFVHVSAITALLLLIALSSNAVNLFYVCKSANCGMPLWVALLTFVPLIMVAAFFYEWLALTILDMVGTEARSKNRDGLVALSFGIMGMGSAVSVILFSRFASVQGKHVGWIVTVIASVFVTNLAIRSIRNKSRHLSPLTPAAETSGNLG